MCTCVCVCVCVCVTSHIPTVAPGIQALSLTVCFGVLERDFEGLVFDGVLVLERVTNGVTEAGGEETGGGEGEGGGDGARAGGEDV